MNYPPHDNALEDALATDGSVDVDVLIVGSGPGGSAAANGFIGSGLRVLVAERGGFVPQLPRGEIPTAMYVEKRYANAGTWIDVEGRRRFRPGTYYYVGGNTNFYGAALSRYHVQDFERATLPGGVSKPWPFTYDDLEPYYSQAEQLYRIRGSLGEDPTEPYHSEPYPFPAIEHSPDIARFADSLKAQGLHPFHAPNGLEVTTQAEVDEEKDSDGIPSFAGRKATAWNRLLEPALEADENIRLVTELRITELVASDDGARIVEAEAEYRGKTVRIRAGRFILGAGAANTAAILLRSGVANSSGQVGRNYMVHNITFMVAVNPFRRNRTTWQKTLGLNDWFLPAGERPGLGNVQMLGKVGPQVLKGVFPFVPTFLLRFVTDRSVDFCLVSEDLARPENRITVKGDQIAVRWRRTNAAAHRQLVRNTARAARKAGFFLVFRRLMDGLETNSHQNGTAVAGSDPATSVVDGDCRAHDVENLWVVDSSIFPSAGANNPVLTITANALRVVDTIRGAMAAAGER